MVGISRCRLSRRNPRLRPTSIHDFEAINYTEKRGHNFALNAPSTRLKPERHDALIIPGAARRYIALNPRVSKSLHFSRPIKPLAASATPRKFSPPLESERKECKRAYPDPPALTLPRWRHVRRSP